MTTAITIRHWKEPIKNTIDSLERAIQSGLAVGDIEFACHAATFLCAHLFFMSEHLEIVAAEFERHIAFIEKFQQQYQLELLKIYSQLIANLACESTNKDTLTGNFINEPEILQRSQAVNNVIFLFYIYCFKLKLAYLFRKIDRAIENARLAANFAGNFQDIVLIVEYTFYSSLALITSYTNLKQNKQEREKTLNLIEKNLEKMKYWAYHAPMNYQHKYDLVLAEKAQICEQTFTAMEYYDRAINGAIENGFVRDEAIANELAAEFYLSLNRIKIARIYLIDAYYSYIRWGAIAKIKDLEKRYPQLLSKIFQQQSNYFESSNPTNTTTESVETVLDFPAIMQASLVISSELKLAQLLRKLIKISIENAGAQYGLLILAKENKLLIEFAGITQENGIEIQCLTSIPIETSKMLPLTVINYVKITQQNIILDRAIEEGIFTTDPYIINNKVKSILCTPISYQGRLLGILYLENNFTPGAFTPTRLQILQILASHAAIALENAILYASLEEKVAERTQELQTKNKQLQQIKNELEKANQELERLATVDGLTQIANRRQFDRYLEQQWKSMMRERVPLSLILCDIDYFKLYNDNYGHQAGDDCLRSVAQAISRAVKRPTDLVARYGGEEFAVILPKTPTRGAVEVSQLMQQEIYKLQILHARSRVSEFITLSIGIATIVPTLEHSSENLIATADRALYQAKEQGRNRAVFQ